MICHGLEDGPNHGIGRKRCIASNDLLQPCPSEQVPALVAGVNNSIAEKYEHVSRLGIETELFVLGLIKQSQRYARSLDDLCLAVVTIDWPGKTGIGHPQRALIVIPHRVNQSHKLAIDAALAERKVHRRKHLRR